VVADGREVESIEVLPATAVNDVLEFNGGKSFASSTVTIQFPPVLFWFFIPDDKISSGRCSLIECIIIL